MFSHNEIAQEAPPQEMNVRDEPVPDAFWIEAILNRAHELRRARGGLFGYDFEDWFEAARELDEESGGARARSELNHPLHSTEGAETTGES